MGQNAFIEENVMVESENLLPCPFCGGAGEVKTLCGDFVYVRCLSCDAETKSFPYQRDWEGSPLLFYEENDPFCIANRLKAIAAWNARATPVLHVKCSDCLFWERLSGHWISEIGTVFGECDCPKVAGWDDRKRDSLYLYPTGDFGHESAGLLYVGEDFGCIHWEKKDV